MKNNKKLFFLAGVIFLLISTVLGVVLYKKGFSIVLFFSTMLCGFVSLVYFIAHWQSYKKDGSEILKDAKLKKIHERNTLESQARHMSQFGDMWD